MRVISFHIIYVCSDRVSLLTQRSLLRCAAAAAKAHLTKLKKTGLLRPPLLSDRSGMAGSRSLLAAVEEGEVTTDTDRDTDRHTHGACVAVAGWLAVLGGHP